MLHQNFFSALGGSDELSAGMSNLAFKRRHLHHLLGADARSRSVLQVAVRT